MAVRKVIQAGDPRLKSKNKLVKSIKSAKTKQLIKDLVATMHKEDLIGIAAPQIGENYQVFVTEPRSTKSRKGAKNITDQLRVYINPKFTFKSKEESIIYEGCGSVSDFGPVSRPNEVKVVATDEKGQKFSLLADGLLARVIQHEMDHLKGVEFIQKVTDYNKIMVHANYIKYIRNSPLQKINSKITKIEYKKL
jgi:peptide deformylase